MDTARYIVAVLVCIGLPPAIVHWLIIHPFVGFWRKRGKAVTSAVVAGHIRIAARPGLRAAPGRNARGAFGLARVDARVLRKDVNVAGGRNRAVGQEREGVEPEDLTIGALVERVGAGGGDEIILASVR